MQSKEQKVINLLAFIDQQTSNIKAAVRKVMTDDNFEVIPRQVSGTPGNNISYEIVYSPKVES